MWIHVHVQPSQSCTFHTSPDISNPGVVAMQGCGQGAWLQGARCLSLAGQNWMVNAFPHSECKYPINPKHQGCDLGVPRNGNLLATHLLCYPLTFTPVYMYSHVPVYTFMCMYPNVDNLSPVHIRILSSDLACTFIVPWCCIWAFQSQVSGCYLVKVEGSSWTYACGEH